MTRTDTAYVRRVATISGVDWWRGLVARIEQRSAEIAGQAYRDRWLRRFAPNAFRFVAFPRPMPSQVEAPRLSRRERERIRAIDRQATEGR